MQIIIVNLIGEAFRGGEVLFRPFRADELYWINRTPAQIAECVEDIHHRYTMIHEDYHLVVLMDLSALMATDSESFLEDSKKLLQAYLTENLLKPLYEQYALIPDKVTEIFVAGGPRKAGKKYSCPLLKGVFSCEMNEVLKDDSLKEYLTLTMKTGDESFLFSFSELFASPVHGFYGQVEYIQKTTSIMTAPNPVRRGIDVSEDPDFPEYSEGKSEEEKLQESWADLEKNMRAALRQSIPLRYQLAGEKQSHTLEPREYEFPVAQGDRKLAYLDLQRQLANLVCSILDYDDDNFTITPLSEKQIIQQLKDTYGRLSRLETQTYYPLEFQVDDSELESLEQNMLEALRGVTDVFGLEWTIDQMISARAGEDDEDYDTILDELAGKIQNSWINVGKQIRQFREQYEIMLSHYIYDNVDRSQTKILQICAGYFQEYRAQQVSELPPLAELQPISFPDAEQALAEPRQLLREAQERCADTVVDQLENYGDVREEAREIKKKFDQASMFWYRKTNERAVGQFQRFSLIMGILFCVMMIGPYVLIEAGKIDAGIPQFVVFLCSFALFLLIYMVGMLVYLQHECRVLYRLVLQLNRLIRKSLKRRRKSVEAAVQAYSKDFPKNLLYSREIRRLTNLAERNRSRAENYNIHKNYVNELLEYLEILLNQVDPHGTFLDVKYSNRNRTTGIDYDRPVYDGVNRKYYMLLSDEEFTDLKSGGES